MIYSDSQQEIKLVVVLKGLEYWASGNPKQVLQCRNGEQQLSSEQLLGVLQTSLSESIVSAKADKHLSSKQQGIVDSNNTPKANTRDKYFIFLFYYYLESADLFVFH